MVIDCLLCRFGKAVNNTKCGSQGGNIGIKDQDWSVLDAVKVQHIQKAKPRWSARKHMKESGTSTYVFGET